MKWALVLRSKQTGESVYLGGEYPTSAKALEAVQRDVCERCNSVSVIPVPDEHLFVGRKEGWRPK